AKPGAVRAGGLERHGSGETAAQHHVVVTAVRAYVLHQLERFSSPPEGQWIDDLAHQAVSIGVSRIHDLDVDDGGCILLPEIVALKERPEARSGVRQVDRELVVAHARRVPLTL